MVFKLLLVERPVTTADMSHHMCQTASVCVYIQCVCVCTHTCVCELKYIYIYISHAALVIEVPGSEML